MVKMLKQTGAEIDTNGKNGATGKCAKWRKLVKVVNGKTGRAPETKW